MSFCKAFTPKNAFPRRENPGRGEGGFSLVELSIALMIIALFFTPLVILYQNEMASRQSSQNISKLNNIQESINYFAAAAGRYPVPASLYLGPTSPNFGREHVAAIADCAGWPTPLGVCRAGTGASAVLIGAVPFAALGINPDIAHDYWDNKILYAVTEQQTVTYTPGGGQIVVEGYDTSASMVLTPTGTLQDMVLLSHGGNGRGAYTRAGAAQDLCTGAPTLDQENCDMDNVFVLRRYTNAAGDTVGMASDVPGAAYYDDFIDEQQSIPKDLWLQSTADPAYALTLANKIGIGTADPQARVHVVGEVRADRILSDDVCSSSAPGCFDPEIITGAVPQMDCNQNTLTGGEAVLSIGNSKVDCASPVNASGTAIDGRAYEFPAAFFARIDCAVSGKNMVGIDVTGVPICM